MDAFPASSDTAAVSCYYSLLGIRRNASPSDVRAAYRRLALRWHPDRWAKEPAFAASQAKRRFQRIQEAYSVLSDKSKRAMYDAGLYDPLDGDDQGFADFMQEMLAMMEGVKSEKPDSLEDLQRMLAEIVGDTVSDPGTSDGGANTSGRRGPSDSTRRSRGGGPMIR
ncbi:chaperone protein DnaJ-like [Zingiber officinale]|nr:chaperone protein DnaJ-like [Zingiber officinale]